MLGPLLRLLTILLATYQFSYSYTFTPSQFQLTDLESTSNSLFSTEAAAWTLSAKVGSSNYTQCGSYHILGGYNVLGTSTTSFNHYFQRDYTSLPSHNMIYFSLKFIAIDSWESVESDSFQLQFDGRIFNGWIFDQSQYNQHLCGNNAIKDLDSLTIFGRVYHSSQSLRFKVISKIDEPSSSESFGFRDITMLFVTAPETTTEEITGRGPTSLSLYTNQQCTGYTQYSDSTCLSCHANCDDCFGPSERECYKCKPGKNFNGYACISSCHPSCTKCFGETADKCMSCQPGYYLANNNTCVASCNPPLVRTSDGTKNFCESRCNSTQFAYWNLSCLSSCNLPLNQTLVATFKLCSNPCPNQYLYPNQTCHSTCSLPWRTRNDSGVQYCEYPCRSDQALYWDGTCQSSCPFPFLHEYEGTLRFCKYPCLSNQYLYPDGTCSNTCPSSMSTREQGGAKFCYSKCADQKFLYFNGSCLDQCDLPFRIKATTYGRLCEPPCTASVEYYYEETQECKNSCDMITWSDSSGAFLKCLEGPETENIFKSFFLGVTTETGKLSILAVPKMLDYIRYLDIKASPRLQRLMKTQARPYLSLRYGYHMPKTMQAEFPKHSIPGMFERTDLHSSFAVNFWEDISSYAVMLGIAIVFILLERSCEKLGWQTLQAAFAGLKTVVKWNFFVVLVATGLDNIILFSALEFRTFQADTFTAVFSLIVCIAVIAFAIAFLINILYLIPMYNDAKADANVQASHHKYADFLLEWQSLQVLYRGFHEDGSHKQYFFIIYTIRMALPMLIVCCVSEIPLMQTILYCFVSIVIILYIYMAKPLKKRINNIQLIVIETIILIININLLILTILELAGVSRDDVGIVFGDIVISLVFILNVVVLCFLAIKIILCLKNAEEIYRKIPEMGKAILIQTLYLPIQQGGLGFEQVQLAGFINNDVVKEKSSVDEIKEPSSKYRHLSNDESFEKKNNEDMAKLKAKSVQSATTRIDDKQGDRYLEEIEDELEIFGDISKEKQIIKPN